MCVNELFSHFYRFLVLRLTMYMYTNKSDSFIPQSLPPLRSKKLQLNWFQASGLLNRFHTTSLISFAKLRSPLFISLKMSGKIWHTCRTLTLTFAHKVTNSCYEGVPNNQSISFWICSAETTSSFTQSLGGEPQKAKDVPKNSYKETDFQCTKSTGLCVINVYGYLPYSVFAPFFTHTV